MLFKKTLPEPPLHQAVINNDPDLLRTLLAKGESVEETNALGFTALEIARLLDHTLCLDVLDPYRYIPNIPIVLPGQSVRRLFKANELQQKIGLRYLAYPRFCDYPTLIWAASHAPYILTKGVESKECCALVDRFRLSINQGYSADMTAVWMNPEIGYGLITNRHLEEDTFIGLYTGVVRPLDFWRSDSNAWCARYPLSFFSSKYLAVDACREGNLMRFANHSDTPNLTAHYGVDRGLLYILIITNHWIPRGAFLTLDYGPGYWKKRRKLETL